MSYDAVIIGSGAGGSAAAWSLTRQGAAVLVLEAGPRFDPVTDYPLTNHNWERTYFPVKPGSQAKVLYGDLGTLNSDDATLQSWNRVDGRPLLASRRHASAIGYSHVMGVGGSTLHYIGEAHRLHPSSFHIFQDHGTGTDWPLTYDDLEPYYAIAETLIGVAGPDTPSARWRSAPYPLPAHPLSPAADRLAQAGSAMGLPFQANARAALSQPYDDRPACNYCGQCHRGCPLGDKGSADKTFLRHASETGRMTLLPEARVIGFESGPNGTISALNYLRGGQTHRQETPILILAAGAVQTPRLLLSHQDNDHPDGLANGSGQVGRNFMETLSFTSTALLPGLRDSHKGLPADAICWTHNAPDAVDGAVGGCRYTSAIQDAGLTGPIAYGTRLVPGFGEDFKAAMRKSFGTAISVGAIGAVLPDARSRITLSPDQRDEFGQPLPVISSVLTENSLTLLHHMARTTRALLSATGADSPIEEYGTWDQFTATHVFGTARMGTDSTTSVTNAWGRCHDHPNLWISDASLFPSTGGGEAPSLTIQALAIRMADHILS